MRNLRKAAQVSLLVLVVAASAIVFFVPTDAKASCWTPKRRVVTYYAWNYNNAWHCDPYPLGPALPPSMVGERITECDGTVTQWGMTTCSNNTVITTETCETVCN